MKNVEWKVLETITLGLTTEKKRKRFDSLIERTDLNWGELLEQAIRHKVLPLLAFVLVSQNKMGVLPKFISRHLREVLEVNNYRLKVYREAAIRIAEALTENDLRFACTKGIALESTVYGGQGQRYMEDVDFMIRPEDGKIVSSIMREMRYISGYSNWKTGEIHEFTRSELLAYRLNPDHLPAFVFQTDDPIIPYIHVDFACSFTWTHSKYQMSTSEALESVRLQAVPDFASCFIPVMPEPYQFLFTVLHLFREAWIKTWIELEQSVNLTKFVDVIRLWQKDQSTLVSDEFQQLLDRCGVREPVGWVLVHLDRTFGTHIAEALRVENIPPEFLSSAGGEGGQLRSWKGTMLDRLQARNSKDLFH